MQLSEAVGRLFGHLLATALFSGYFDAFEHCRYEDCFVYYGFDPEVASMLSVVIANAFYERAVAGAMDHVFEDPDHALALVLSRFSDLALEESAYGFEDPM
jgi:hypothetical protein